MLHRNVFGMQFRDLLSPTSERTMRLVLDASASVVVAMATALALDWSGAPERVTAAVAVSCGSVAAASTLRRAWLPVIAALGLTYVMAFALHERAWHDATAACAGAIVAAILLRPVVRSHAMATAEGALDRLEHVAVSASRSLFAVGLFGLVAHHALTRIVGAGALALVVGLLVATLWRDRVRARLLRRLYAGGDARFQIERDREVAGYELLPPLLSGTITNAVIVEIAGTPATYRNAYGPQPVARATVSLAKMLDRIEKRARLAGMLLAALVCCVTVLLVMPLDSSP
jgi:hypothetical protein